MRGSVRRRELSALIGALTAGRSVVVVGSPGSGRTTLCAEVEAALIEIGRPCHVVRGADTVPGVPYAPFAPLLDHLELAAVDGLTVLTRSPSAVAGSGVVVLVDDADLMDQASIVLTGHLARAGTPVAVATSSVEVLPQSMRDAIDADVWEVLGLDPLEIDDVLMIAASLAGDDLDAQSAAEVVEGARGNLRRAVALVTSRLAGAVPSPAGVRLGPVVPDEHLRDLVVHDLADPARHLVGLLAVADGLPADAFSADERDVLGAAATAAGDGDLRVTDPLLGQLVLADADAHVTRHWAAEVAGRLEDRPGWSATATLMRLRAGARVPDTERIAAAADAAADVVLELLDGVADDPHVLLMRGSAAADVGEVDVALEALDAAATTEAADVVAGAARRLGLLHAVRRGDPATAVQVVESLLPRVSAAARQDLEAELVKWRLMAGLPTTAPTLSGVTVTESVIGAMVASLDGPVDEAVRHVAAGQESLAMGAVGPPFAAELLQLSGFLADVFAGRIGDAAAGAQSLRDAAARTADPVLGMWEMATAELALHDGRHEMGLQIATRAQRHLAWRDFTGLGPTTVALRAALAARTGRHALALDLAPTVEEHRADVKVHLHLARVDAERRRQSQDARSAAETLSEAGRQALAEAHGHLGLLAVDEAVMIRPRESDVALLVEHVAASPLYALLAARAEALLVGDGERLAGLADELDAMGLTGRAAHAAFAAAHATSSSPEQARRWRSRAVLLASGTTRWACDDEADALTARELDVARLAAQRLRSREIGEALGLSARTVDNHLGRAFRKLGVNSRDELPEALGLVPDHGR